MLVYTTRKAYPVASGVLDYFPDALLAVAHCSWQGNEQHNPGEPLHWAREKSTDEADALLRHFMQRGTLDSDGVPHSAKVATSAGRRNPVGPGSGAARWRGTMRPPGTGAWSRCPARSHAAPEQAARIDVRSRK